MKKFRIIEREVIDLYEGEWQVVTHYIVQRRVLWLLWLDEHSSKYWDSANQYLEALKQMYK